MFLLTESHYNDYYIKGVFTSVKKAKKYVRKVMKEKHLHWSDPASNPEGAICAVNGLVEFHIEPIEQNPKK